MRSILGHEYARFYVAQIAVLLIWSREISTRDEKGEKTTVILGTTKVVTHQVLMN